LACETSSDLRAISIRRDCSAISMVLLRSMFACSMARSLPIRASSASRSERYSACAWAARERACSSAMAASFSAAALARSCSIRKAWRSASASRWVISTRVFSSTSFRSRFFSSVSLVRLVRPMASKRLLGLRCLASV